MTSMHVLLSKDGKHYRRHESRRRGKSTSMAEEKVYYTPTRDLAFPLSLSNGV
jgi:hypothetical protein